MPTYFISHFGKLKILQESKPHGFTFEEVQTLQGASQVGLVGKNLPASVGDLRDKGSIPGSGRSPGAGHGNPLQHSCLENPMERSWRAAVRGGQEELDTPEGLGTRAPGAARPRALHLHQCPHRSFSPGSWAESCLGGPSGVGPGHSSLALSPTRPVKAVPPATPYRGPSQHCLTPRGQDSQGQHPQLPGLRPTGE